MMGYCDLYKGKIAMREEYFQTIEVNKFLEYVKKYVLFNDVKTIFNIGCRDHIEISLFSKIFENSQIYAWEGNPECYNDILEGIKYKKNITLIQKAAHNYDGITKFYATDLNKSDLSAGKLDVLGYSSCYKLLNNYTHRIEQKEIKIQCQRIDSFCDQNGIKEIDLVWMDVEGAAYVVLEGFGDLIRKIKILRVEVSINPIREGEIPYPQINKLLEKNNLFYLDGDLNAPKWTDLVYVNKFITPLGQSGVSP